MFSPSRWNVHRKGCRWIWLRQRHHLGDLAQPLVLPEGDHHEAHSPQPHHSGRWTADGRETVRRPLSCLKSRETSLWSVPAAVELNGTETALKGEFVSQFKQFKSLYFSPFACSAIYQSRPSFWCSLRQDVSRLEVLKVQINKCIDFIYSTAMSLSINRDLVTPDNPQTLLWAV